MNVTDEELDELRSLHQLGVEAARREHMEHAKRWHLLQERLWKRVAVRRARRQEVSRQELASAPRQTDVSVSRQEHVSISRREDASACRQEDPSVSSVISVSSVSDMGVEGQSRCEEFGTGKPVSLVGSVDEAEALRKAHLFALL